jgi:hypothetical protein
VRFVCVFRNFASMKKQPTFTSSRSLLHGVFALCLFAMAFCWDSGLAYPTKPAKTCCQAKKKCCDKKQSCPTTPQKQSTCPSSCPCATPHTSLPSQVILSNEDIVAYQTKKKKQSYTHTLYSALLYKSASKYTQEALPALVLPIATGKERLKRFEIWRV